MSAIKQVTIGSFTGMNNKAPDRNLPDDKLRNAVNVIFSNNGLIKFPGWGKTKVYTGVNCHSLFTVSGAELFVENGTLKLLNNDYSATVLRQNVGHTPMFYTSIGTVTYFCNEAVTGKFDSLTHRVSEWGTARPPRQPTIAIGSLGGLFAGDYRVAITWLADEESGTGRSVKISVPEGGGIQLSNFPVPPAYVKKVAVYVSSVNGKDLYLYGEYPPAINYVNIFRLTTNGVIPSIPLTTQFCFPPKPTGLIAGHQGRIYYASGAKVYYTMPRRYGLQAALAYWTFPSEVKTIQSSPPFLFIGTADAMTSVTGIDNAGSAPQFNRIKNYGCAFNASVTDKDDSKAYAYSDNGFIQCSGDGTISELSYENNAIPAFKNGAITILERDGTKYLLFSGTSPLSNKLADPTYLASELARNSI